MPAILAAFGAFFTFEKWDKVVQWVLRGITFGKMVAVNLAIVVTIGLYCGAVTTLLLFVYEKSNQFINLINDMTSGASNDILAWAMDILKAFGLWNAFVDVYSIFSVPIISLFVIYGYKLGLRFLHSIQMTLISFNVARL
ncbi:hypothetical protein [Campylobacter sp. RM15925]|uniref:hypothetical protein n=1 Tax=Campylobacter sp. RM15925 TaxID=1705724 RepID=UPI001474DB84|nr:hypothetical protein [Campylobacter sp. RM15925]